MSDKIRYVRQLSPESAGEAPGRGRLQGRRILVVGGGQRTFDAATDPVGNGRAMSLLFAREGAHVAVADLNRASADDTVQRIMAEGGQAFSIEANIAREEDVNRMIDEAIEGLGGLDGMVLNVGIGVGALGLDGVDLKEWNDTFAVNLTGPMLCCRKALKHIADGSSIVFISSIAALRSGSQLIAYDASKAALGGLMRNVAKGGRQARHSRQHHLPGTGRYAARPAYQRRPAVAKRGGCAVRADGDGLGNCLRGAVFHLRRERLRQRPGAGGRQRNHRAIRAGIRRENLIRHRADRSNKSTAEGCPDEANIAIFLGISTT
jgi:NAD(P)-dependent dehydrogenase (short-subunit alcohol dehydrogenase family)